MVATELIAGWWRSDRLFCVAVAFLALVFAMATVGGVILLLLRQPLGRYLIVAGAVVAILTYLGVFIAGARVAWIVHTLPILPITSAVLTLLPRTRDWLLEDLELRDGRVIVHQLDPPRAAEVDQRHRRFADAGHLLDAPQPVLVVGDPVAGCQRQQRALATAAAACRRRARRAEPAGPTHTGALNDGVGSVRRQSMSSCGISRRNRDSGLSIGCPHDDRILARLTYSR